MNPSMDDRRILAEMERRLSRDDPELVELMDALNHQFPDGEEDTDSRTDDGGRHDWRWKAIVAFAVVLVAGLILTAIFSRSPSTDDNHGPPNGRAPAVSVHTQGRGSRPRAGTGATPAGQQRRSTDLPWGSLMRARDLAQSYVSLSKDDNALEAVRLLVEQNLPGLLEVDPDGQPYAALPACDIVRALVPGYIQEDPVLTEVIDEPHADRLCRTLAGRKLVDRMPVGRPFLPTAAPDCTAMEIAELMARTRSPLVAVVERAATGPAGRLLGVVTAAHLLKQLLQA